MSAGFDYSMGTANVDNETGIHYGVIHAGDVGQYWYDDSESDYGPPMCGYCGNNTLWELTEQERVVQYDVDGRYYDYQCTACDKYLTDDDVWSDTPIAWFLHDAQYDAQQSGDSTDIFVLRSPYYTLCQFCSPCAPGAGYLTSQAEDGTRAYCFGHDWFEDGKAPYVVYRVDDNSIVNPELGE